MFLLKIGIPNETTSVTLTLTHTHTTCYLLSTYRHIYCYIDRLVFALTTLPEFVSIQTKRNTHIYILHTIFAYMYVHSHTTHTHTLLYMYVCVYIRVKRAPFVPRVPQLGRKNETNIMLNRRRTCNN